MRNRRPVFLLGQLPSKRKKMPRFQWLIFLPYCKCGQKITIKSSLSAWSCENFDVGGKDLNHWNYVICCRVRLVLIDFLLSKCNKDKNGRGETTRQNEWFLKINYSDIHCKISWKFCLQNISVNQLFTEIMKLSRILWGILIDPNFRSATVLDIVELCWTKENISKFVTSITLQITFFHDYSPILSVAPSPEKMKGNAFHILGNNDVSS